MISPMISAKLTKTIITDIFLFKINNLSILERQLMSSLVHPIASELSTVGNDDLLGRLSVSRSEALHLSHHIHTLDDTSKHNVLSVEPGSQTRINAPV